MKTISHYYYQCLALIGAYFIYLSRLTKLSVVSILISNVVFIPAALAGNGGGDDEFSDLYEYIVQLSEGNLMLIFAVVAFLLGLYGAIIKHSFAFAGTCMGIAIACKFGPDIVVNMAGAVI